MAEITAPIIRSTEKHAGHAVGCPRDPGLSGPTAERAGRRPIPGQIQELCP